MEKEHPRRLEDGFRSIETLHISLLQYEADLDCRIKKEEEFQQRLHDLELELQQHSAAAQLELERVRRVKDEQWSLRLDQKGLELQEAEQRHQHELVAAREAAQCKARAELQQQHEQEALALRHHHEQVIVELKQQHLQQQYESCKQQQQASAGQGQQHAQELAGLRHQLAELQQQNAQLRADLEISMGYRKKCKQIQQEHAVLQARLEEMQWQVQKQSRAASLQREVQAQPAGQRAEPATAVQSSRAMPGAAEEQGQGQLRQAGDAVLVDKYRAAKRQLHALRSKLQEHKDRPSTRNAAVQVQPGLIKAAARRAAASAHAGAATCTAAAASAGTVAHLDVGARANADGDACAGQGAVVLEATGLAQQGTAAADASVRALFRRPRQPRQEHQHQLAAAGVAAASGRVQQRAGLAAQQMAALSELAPETAAPPSDLGLDIKPTQRYSPHLPEGQQLQQPSRAAAIAVGQPSGGSRSAASAPADPAADSTVPGAQPNQQQGQQLGALPSLPSSSPPSKQAVSKSPAWNRRASARSKAFGVIKTAWARHRMGKGSVEGAAHVDINESLADDEADQTLELRRKRRRLEPSVHTEPGAAAAGAEAAAEAGAEAAAGAEAGAAGAAGAQAGEAIRSGSRSGTAMQTNSSSGLHTLKSVTNLAAAAPAAASSSKPSSSSQGAMSPSALPQQQHQKHQKQQLQQQHQEHQKQQQQQHLLTNTSTVPGSPRYKYNAVVRNRWERQALTAVDCAQCAAFFAAIASWGGQVEGPDMVCKHGEGGKGACQVDVDKLRQEVSRHRYKYVPPATPEGFWDLEF